MDEWRDPLHIVSGTVAMAPHGHSDTQIPRPLLTDGFEALYARLDRYTLADLMVSREAFEAVLVRH